jgi:sigma-B regulation protein RsbU (phosphoserine phosphatase)
VETGWRLRASNGGMVAPLFLTGGGSCQYVEASGLPLGAVKQVHYNETEAHLTAGDVLVICSDGILESMNAHRELFSFDRLQQALGELGHHNAAEIAARLLEAARNFAGSAELEDDATIVVIKVHEEQMRC